MAEYRLPLDGSFEASEDWAAFAGWSREFRRRCSANGWLERARLSDFLRDKNRGRRSSRPSAVFMAGFDEMTPQQTEFMDALGEWRAVEMRNYSPAAERRKLRDSSEEIRSAAAWARRLLEIGSRNTNRHYCCAGSDALRGRKWNGFFGEVLGARGISPFRRAAARGISSSARRSAHAGIRTGQVALAARGNAACDRPFLGGAEKEWGKRAQLDAKLRKNGVWDVTLAELAR